MGTRQAKDRSIQRVLVHAGQSLVANAIDYRVHLEPMSRNTAKECPRSSGKHIRPLVMSARDRKC